MWTFINGMTRGTRRNSARPFPQTWSMLMGAGMGIAAWELARRQNFSWFRNTADRMTRRVSGRRRERADFAD